ncbi:MAG: DUF1501 domain-containing protein, partial [Gemmataceae bacterium]
IDWLRPLRGEIMQSINIDLSRRDWFRWAGAAALSASGWLGRLAAAEARPPRSCILLWMNGGPSQIDTFDLKPGHANGGPFKEIATSVPGIKISEHLPGLAKRMEHLALVRSLSGREGEHGQASFFAHTGYVQRGPIQYPTLGSLVARQLEDGAASLPGFVSIAPFRALNAAAHAPGFLGPRYASLSVGADQAFRSNAGAERPLGVENLAAPDAAANRFASRWQLLERMQSRFDADHPDGPAQAQRTAYQRAVRMMRQEAAKVFKLDDEPARVRDAYGRNAFGQGCLLARRLVEHRVPFVEVSLGGQTGIDWDTHSDNFARVRTLSNILDAAWSQLLDDLKGRGLLESTLIVWMGEFGRTPTINGSNGRDHYPLVSSAALAGGRIKAGQVIGKTSKDGAAVSERPVSLPEFLATVFEALDIDPQAQNTSNTSRPIPLVETGTRPVRELLRPRA